MAAQRLTRKHFNAIAEAIKGITESVQFPNDKQEQALSTARDDMAETMADIVGPLNDNFDRERFIKACTQ